MNRADERIHGRAPGMWVPLAILSDVIFFLQLKKRLVEVVLKHMHEWNPVRHVRLEMLWKDEWWWWCCDWLEFSSDADKTNKNVCSQQSLRQNLWTQRTQSCSTSVKKRQQTVLIVQTWCPPYDKSASFSSLPSPLRRHSQLWHRNLGPFPSLPPQTVNRCRRQWPMFQEETSFKSRLWQR